MPVPMKIVSLFQSDAGWGWSEVHYKLSSGDNPQLKNQLDAYIANVIQLRVGILGSDCAFVGARISYPRAGNIASFGTRQYIRSTAVGQPGASWAESLALNFVDSTTTKRKISHIRGYWDSVVQNGTYTPNLPAAADWQSRLEQWKAAILNNYGWMSKDPVTSGEAIVSNYVTSPDQIVTFTLRNPGIPTAPLFRVVPMTFSRINGSKSVLNRTLLCQFLTAETCFTIKPIAAGDFISEGKASYRATTFVGYADTASISAGKRSMGRPLNRPLGRSKARPTT